MALDYELARSWSKERIWAEIRQRDNDIYEVRRNLEYEEADYASRGFRDAPQSWDRGYYIIIGDLEREKEYLRSLL